MKLRDFISRINTWLGNYTFTAQFTQADIIFHINDALSDMYTTHNWWFMMKRFQSVVEATEFNLGRTIYNVVSVREVDWETNPELTKQKWWRFLSELDTDTTKTEYSHHGNTLFVSKSMKVDVTYFQWPQWFTWTEAELDSDLEIYNDFLWILFKKTLVNMVPMFLSDGIPLSENYHQRAELQMQKLQITFWEIFSNDQVRANDGLTNRWKFTR